MRVTQSMLTDTLLRNLERNANRLDQIQGQISSGQRISQLSDDPIGMAAVLRLDSTKAQQDQFVKNIDDGRSWLDASDQALGSIGDALSRARELALQAANGTLAPGDLNAIASELKQLIDHAVETGNAQVAGQYIFAGQKTRTAPFDASTTPPTYQGDNGDILRMIDAGVTVPVNVTGDSAIQPALNALTQVYNAVVANDPTAIRAGIDAVDAANTTLLAARTDIGARENRLDAQRQRLTALQTTVAKLRSDVQDVDMAEAITDYSTQLNVYQAALQVGAKIIQPSLIDYLP